MLTSCSAVEALKYSISGDIIDPVDDFSRGSDKDTFVFGGNDYIFAENITQYILCSSPHFCHKI